MCSSTRTNLQRNSTYSNASLETLRSCCFSDYFVCRVYARVTITLWIWNQLCWCFFFNKNEGQSQDSEQLVCVIDRACPHNFLWTTATLTPPPFPAAHLKRDLGDEGEGGLTWNRSRHSEPRLMPSMFYRRVQVTDELMLSHQQPPCLIYIVVFI